jgi:hypothetical protein
VNILDLQNELNKQIEALQNELNKYVKQFGYCAILTKKRNGFRFDIVSDLGKEIGYFEDFTKSGKENIFKDEHYYHCKVIIDSYSIL